MGNKKPSKGVSSNISSTANPAASSTLHSNKSSILRSSFSPSHFQLSLFASVIQGLDSQHLRIHDTATGRLRCEHKVASKASINCLDWGHYGENHRDRHHQESNRKRKRNDFVNRDSSKDRASDIVLAFGTSDSEIHIFSPAEAKMVGSLKGGHTQGIRDFKFVDYGLDAQGWSVGGDGKLVQWNLKTYRSIRTIILPHGLASTLRPLQSSVICALQNAYIVDPETEKRPPTFVASTNTVHTILESKLRSPGGIMFLTAAESDHFITVFNADSPTLTGSLRTENEIKCLDICSNLDYDIEGEQTIDHSIRMVRPQEVLATVSKDGVLEVFPEPFIFGSSSSKNQSDNVKSRMMQRTRKATAQIRIRRNDKASTLVPLLNASFRGNDILMVWAEGGINLAFDTVQWRDEATGNIVLKDVLDIFKAKDGPGIGAVVMNGAKDLGKVHVDESRTVVANGLDADDVPMGDRSPEIITISSGEEESEYEEEGPLSQMNGGVQMQENEEKERETPYNADIEMEDVNAEAANGQNQESASGADADTEEPSFGDLIRANTAGVVDVQAAFTDPNAQSLVRADDRDLQQLPSGMSLGTVLTQSLRTNDTNLLETCFHVKNLQTVRATIERLDSSFATTLLQRLAERLHSRPGRAGSLMVWIQWTLVAHGGYLAGQPEIMKKLASLHRIVKERANSLHSLLSLKGKLDMLEAQMNLRKSIQARSRAAKAMDEGDEDAVIYVEGQEESSSGGEYEEDLVGSPHSERTIKTRDGPSKDVSGESDSGVESELDERTTEMPATVIGVANTDDEGSESEEDGFKDEEASSTDNDSLDEVSEDEIDHDSVDADSSDADTSPPPKRPAKSKLSNGIGRKKR